MSFQAFRAAACEFSGSVNFLIPKGTYLIGPIQFAGPCHNVSSLTVRLKARLRSSSFPHVFFYCHLYYSIEFDQVIYPWLNLRNLQGYLKATTDLSKYGFSAGWVEFGWVEGLTLTGGGTFDGQGATAWPYNNCPTDSNCKLLPTVCFMNYIPFSFCFFFSLHLAYSSRAFDKILPSRLFELYVAKGEGGRLRAVLMV